MDSIVRSRIIKIGNSQGIRIPKVLLEQARLGDEVELELGANGIIIRPVQSARHGWDETFQMMAEHGDDDLLDVTAPSVNTWDEDEWQW